MAVRTRENGSAWTRATCSWTASACRAAREREHMRFRDRDYTLRGSESRTLASVGAFRVVPAHDLRDTFDKPWTRAMAICGICAIRGSSKRSASTATRPPSR